MQVDARKRCACRSRSASCSAASRSRSASCSAASRSRSRRALASRASRRRTPNCSRTTARATRMALSAAAIVAPRLVRHALEHSTMTSWSHVDSSRSRARPPISRRQRTTSGSSHVFCTRAHAYATVSTTGEKRCSTRSGATLAAARRCLVSAAWLSTSGVVRVASSIRLVWCTIGSACASRPPRRTIPPVSRSVKHSSSMPSRVSADSRSLATAMIAAARDSSSCAVSSASHAAPSNQPPPLDQLIAGGATYPPTLH